MIDSPALREFRKRRYVSTRATADYLGFTVRTVYTMIGDGRLTGYKIGRRIRIDLNEVDEAMNRARIGGNTGGEAA